MKKRKQKPPVSAGRTGIASSSLFERPWVHAAALAFLCLVVYGAALGNGFVSDDNFLLLGNPLVKDWRKIPAIFGHSVWALTGAVKTNYYRPLQVLSYMGVYEVFGFDPRAFHFLMLLLHSAATIFVYLVARAALRELRIADCGLRISNLQAAMAAAFLAGAVFAVHPIHSEAVLWVAALPDVLVAVFVLAGLFLFVRTDGRPRFPQALGIAALYAAGLLTKETGAMLLPLLAGWEVLVLRRRLRHLLANVQLYALLGGVTCAYLALRLHVLGAFAPAQGSYIRLSTWEYFFSAVSLAGRYLWKLVLPLGLNYFHVFDPVRGPNVLWALALLSCAGVVAAIVWLRLRANEGGPRSAATDTAHTYSYIAFCLFFIAITIAPVLNITGVGPNPFAERYLYLPSAGFALLIPLAWQWVLARIPTGARKAAWVALGLVLAAACAQVWARTPDWHDDLTLFTRTAQQSPRASLVRGNIGWWHMQRGEWDAAESAYRAALAIDPNSTLLHNNLGNVLGSKKQYPEAIRELRRAIELKPDYAEAHFNLGLALEMSGDVQKGLAEYGTAVAIQPGYPQALTALGTFFLGQGQAAPAADYYRRAIKSNDEFAEAHMNLGLALSAMGKDAESVQELRRALELAPTHPQIHIVHYSLGLAYQKQRANDAAEAEFRAALQSQPDFAAARQALAAVQAAKQQERPSPSKPF